MLGYSKTQCKLCVGRIKLMRNKRLLQVAVTSRQPCPNMPGCQICTCCYSPLLASESSAFADVVFQLAKLVSGGAGQRGPVANTLKLVLCS